MKNRHKHKKNTALVGKSFYRYVDGTIKRLDKDHIDVTSGACLHIRINPMSKANIKRQKEDEEKEIFGYTKKQYEANIINAQRLITCVVGSESWLNGRQKYKDRMAIKDYTDKENAAFNNRSQVVKQNWQSMTYDDKIIKTKNGLILMNEEYTCNICGVKSNKGNITRWHNDRCKSK